MTEEPPHIISIYEKGTWKLLEIVEERRIPHTRFANYPQYAFDVKDEEGNTTTVWIGENQSTGSKYFSFLTAATENPLLSVKHKIKAPTLVGKRIWGLWGKETRTKKEPVDAWLRFKSCTKEESKKHQMEEFRKNAPKKEEPPQEKPPEKKQIPTDYVPPAKPRKEPPKEEKRRPVEVENVTLKRFT